MWGAEALWRFSKYLIAAEIAAFGGAYYVWHKMNISQVDKKGSKEPVRSRDGGRYAKTCPESQDYRKHMHENHPYVLELFYRTAEMAQIKDARPNDYRAWGILGNADIDTNTKSS